MRGVNAFNVIAVDWRAAADTINYPRARAATRLVGAFIGLLIVQLNKLFDAQPEDMLLMGHSLGAHLVAYGAAYVRWNASLGTIAHIVGLDPAGPCFGFTDDAFSTADRLDPTDATLVEAYHTNGELGGKKLQLIASLIRNH